MSPAQRPNGRESNSSTPEISLVYYNRPQLYKVSARSLSRPMINVGKLCMHLKCFILTYNLSFKDNWATKPIPLKIIGTCCVLLPIFSTLHKNGHVCMAIVNLGGLNNTNIAPGTWHSGKLHPCMSSCLWWHIIWGAPNSSVVGKANINKQTSPPASSLK